MNTSRSSLWYFVVLASALGFLFHLIWEYLQCSPLFIHLKDSATSESMVWATLGDVAILWSSYVAVATLRKSFWWPWTFPNLSNWIILSLISAAISAIIEYFAINRQLWTYTAVNPVILGISIFPLFQMIMLNPLTFFIAKRIVVISATIKENRKWVNS